MLGISISLFGVTLVLAGISFGIHGLTKVIKSLPDQLAEKLAEKLQGEEKRKQAERDSDP